MIGAAKAQAGGRDISFGLRDTYTFIGQYDLVVEVGVINYADDRKSSASRGASSATGDTISAPSPSTSSLEPSEAP